MLNRLTKLDYNYQLIKILLQSKIGTVVVNMIAPLCYFYIFFNTIPLNILISWFLIQVLIFAFRMKVGSNLLKKLELEDSTAINKYLSIYLFFIFLNAVMWGVSTIPVLMYGTEFQVFILAIGIFAILSGSASTLTPIFHAIFIYMVTLVLIFILALIIIGGMQIYYLIALFLVLYTLGTISAAYITYSYMSDSIEKNKEIASLNILLKEKVEDAINDTKRMGQTLQEQSRLAQMGEMISMIAHQWRQPLSAISVVSINLKLKSELESFDMGQKQEAQEYEVYVNKSLQKIDGLIENLTTTIDDFRYFYKPNKKPVTARLEDIITKSLKISKASLINSNIELIEEYNSKENIELYDNELVQVVLNIIKNAQDNFKDKQIKNPYIKIITKNKKISICDNGGGISEDIMKKIFDPYFSTKDEKNGTGLGLYMSKTIVEEHHNGKLTAKNTDDGVCFIIEMGNI